MKQFFTRKKWFFILGIIIVFAIIPLITHIIANQYFSDIETAIKWKMNFKSITEITIINGKDGIVYLGKDNYNSIRAFSFDTKVSNNQVKYRIGDTTGIVIGEFWMSKLQTAPNSTEQIVYGIGEKYAQECVKKTGKEANYISIEHNGKPYVLWYIVSGDGLDELPEFQLGGVNSDDKPDITLATAPILFILIIGVVIYSVRKSKKKINRV